MHLNIYRTEFRITEAVRGRTPEYRRPHVVYVQAPSAAPEDILAVLDNNFTIGELESFELLNVAPAFEGNVLCAGEES